MKLLKIVGTHKFFEGNISIAGAQYSLAIVPSVTQNPASPPYQLVYKHENNPFHDTRLSGLFAVKGRPDSYKGDILRNGKKQKFSILIDRMFSTATISR
jgi:hypothetical protein